MKNARLALALVALAPSLACAQWSDNFDSYPVGVLNGPGGWRGWDNVLSACGVISTAQARSGTKSMNVTGPNDAIREFTQYTSGKWRNTAWMYLPSGTVGNPWYIMLNQYVDFGPNNWSLQLEFNTITGMVGDVDTAVRPLNTPQPFVTNQWAEIRVDIDLNADQVTAWYNGAQVTTGPWKRDTLSTLTIDCIDLWANNSTGCFFDDLSIAALGPACRPDLTTTAIPGSPGYGTPNGVLNNDDFFFYLSQFAAGNVAVADMTTTAIPGSPGYGVPNGVINNDDFFFYLSIFAAGC